MPPKPSSCVWGKSLQGLREIETSFAWYYKRHIYRGLCEVSLSQGLVEVRKVLKLTVNSVDDR